MNKLKELLNSDSEGNLNESAGANTTPGNLMIKKLMLNFGEKTSPKA